MHEIRWIDLDGVVNMRDVGGLPTTDGGRIAEGRLIRSDNLQELTDRDVDVLVRELGVTDIVDLRTHVELAREGEGPLHRHPGVSISHFTLYADDAPVSGIPVGERELPWKVQARRAGRDPARVVPTRADHDVHWSDHYLGYLDERPDSVVGALRAIAAARQAVVVHCAAGKDRTGTITGLALVVAGAVPEAVAADYAASALRLERILDRLLRRPAYAQDLAGKSVLDQAPRAETMQRLLDVLDRDHGGVLGWLAAQGWTEQDTARMRAKLR